MKIEILSGCAKCGALEKTVREIAAELKISAEVVKITDINEMVNKGIMIAPALFIDGKKKSEGKVPSKDELKKWLGASAPKTGGCGCGNGCCS